MIILKTFLEKTFPLKTLQIKILLNAILKLVVQKHYMFIIKMNFEFKIFMFY